jgi:flagellar assembly protein FliH
MSARLIKRSAASTASECAPFLLPEIGVGSRPAPEANGHHQAKPLPLNLPKAHLREGNGKAAAAPRAESGVAPEDQALQIIQAARGEAEQLIAEAQARAAAIEEEAKARALAEVQANASAELNRAVGDLRQQFAESLEKLAAMRREIAARAERDLVRLAIEMAKKIVQREVTVDHEVALTLARVALERLHNRAVAKVRLNPDDYHYVSAHRERAGADSSIEIIEDRLVGRGGCLIATEMGDIDARIEQQFAEIERNFLS